MKKGSLLLVDDDRQVLTSMADWLRDQGYKVDVASDYASAVAAVEKKTFDLLLVDIRLGDKDGFEVLAYSRQKNPAVPVILLTGYGSVETAIEAIRAGAFDLLTKPLIDEELQLAIERSLNPSAKCSKKTKILKRNWICDSRFKTSWDTTPDAARVRHD